MLVEKRILEWIMKETVAEFNIAVTQEMEGGLDSMCDLSEGIWERGVAKGQKVIDEN